MNINNLHKIKILGIVDYYHLETSRSTFGTECKSYDYQRNIFIENHGKIIKIKEHVKQDTEQEKVFKEKIINNMAFVEKPDYENYFLVGDLKKKALLKTNVYQDDKIPFFEKFTDSFLTDDDNENISFLYNEDICLVYDGDTLIDLKINDDNFNTYELTDVFPVKEMEYER